jgi:hypothetical protein
MPLVVERHGESVILLTPSSVSSKSISASCNVWFNDLPFLGPNPGGYEKISYELSKAQNLGQPLHPDLLYLKNVRYRAPIPEGIGAVVRALWDYQDESDKRLVLKQGDMIEVITTLDTGWWDGISNGRRGWFPMTYCTASE